MSTFNLSVEIVRLRDLQSSPLQTSELYAKEQRSVEGGVKSCCEAGFRLEGPAYWRRGLGPDQDSSRTGQEQDLRLCGAAPRLPKICVYLAAFLDLEH